MAKKNAVKELYSLLQQVRREPDFAKRPNKWRALWIKDVGSMLTRYTNIARKLAKAEEKLKSLAE